jgi:hypothetical protein
MTLKRIITLATTIIVLAARVIPIFADIAPPLQPPGSNPGPAEFVETNVEMGFESVVIYIGETSTLYYREPSFDTVNARVSALFMMNNTGENEETLAVVFPLNNTEGKGDRDSSYPEIRDFSVSINGQIVDHIKISTPNPQDAEKPEIKWAQFEVEFPPNEVVFIEVEYDLQSTGWFPEATFNYVLETGKGWHGPIGEAHIRLVLPYEASADNVLFGEFANTSPRGEFEGNEVHWDYINLEPEIEDNWSATIITPHIWNEILALRESAAEGDGSAYKALTVIYDSLYIGHGPRPGTEGLVIKNNEAYQAALAYDPDDDDVLARFADFLLTLNEMAIDIEEVPFVVEDVYSLASQALEINPDNGIAARIIQVLEQRYPTSTPSPTEPTHEQKEVRAVETPTAESAQVGTEQKDFPSLLVGGGLVGALGVMIVLVYFIGSKNRGK